MKQMLSLVQSLFLTLLMTLPLCAGVAVMVGLIHEVWSEIKRSAHDGSAQLRRYQEYVWMGVLRDGTPFLGTQTYRNQQFSLTYSWLDGENAGGLDNGNRLNPVELQPSSQQMRIGRYRQRRIFEPFVRKPFQRRRSFFDGSHTWVLRNSPNHGDAYFLAGSAGGNDKVIGYLDRKGSRGDEPEPETCFQEPEGLVASNGLMVFQSGAEVLVVDLKENTVTKVGERSDAIEWGIHFDLRHASPAYRRQVLLLTADAVKILDAAGNVLQSFPVGDQSRELYLGDDQRMFVKTKTADTQESDESVTRFSRLETLYELMNDGTVRKIGAARTGEEHENPTKTTIVWMQKVDEFRDRTFAGFLFPGPAVLWMTDNGITFVVERFLGWSMTEGRGHKSMGVLFPWAMPVSTVFGAIAAYFCYSRQRRYQARWTKTWTVFVFLFGPAGYLAWRWHREWPPAELVGVTREEFEGPAANGLEVFA
ncbi:hypothetical protein [Symmachiella dynata]|uniref:hypothetical protein n=1 Tax=Symmachiella dynata TaxID=2527995 RepID=UPI0030EDFB2D